MNAALQPCATCALMLFGMHTQLSVEAACLARSFGSACSATLQIIMPAMMTVKIGAICERPLQLSSRRIYKQVLINDGTSLPVEALDTFSGCDSSIVLPIAQIPDSARPHAWNKTSLSKSSSGLAHTYVPCLAVFRGLLPGAKGSHWGQESPSHGSNPRGEKSWERHGFRALTGREGSGLTC